MEWSMPDSPPTRMRILSDMKSGDRTVTERMESPIGITVLNTSYNYYSYASTVTCWDESVPNWKERLRRGAVLNNRLYSASTSCDYSPLAYEAVGKSNNKSIKYRGFLAFSWPAFGADYHVDSIKSFPSVNAAVSPDPQSYRGECVTKAWSRVSVSDAEILASLGEMPETVNWFASVMSRLLRIFVAVKRKDVRALKKLAGFKKGKGAPRRIAKHYATTTEDAWMEARYAIRPLLFEVETYFKLLSDVTLPERRKAKAFKLDETSSTSLSSLTAAVNCSVLTETKTTRSITAGVLYQIADEARGWITRLGFDSPIGAMWELTTLSFVFDWFFNVGDWIASWEPKVGLTALTSWVVERLTVETTTTYTPLNFNTAYMGWQSCSSLSILTSGKIHKKTLYKTRWVNPTRQVLPTFNYRPLGAAKLADLLIIGRKLLSQLF